MIKITNDALCTGCGSCESICPQNCIQMSKSEEGFLYPKVNDKLCIKCGACIQRCPVLSPAEIKKTTEDIRSYAMYSKNENLRKTSSSGGIFPELASFVLKNGGVVFGAALDKDVNVHHICIETEEELKKLQGTKYVQSVIGDSYKKAKEFLDNGRYVLFSGTPCQTAGLLSYLKKDYENLFTQDLICHGVPSPLVWEKYKEYIKKEHSSPVESVSFRDKKQGWRGYSISFQFKNGSHHSHPSRNDWYMNAFLRDLCLRPSCYECKFKKFVRPTDITIADFWGVNKIVPEMDDNKGTSLVFINSKKGEALLNGIKPNVRLMETDPIESVKHNPSMTSSASIPKERAKFMKEICHNDFEFVINKYLKVSFWGKVKRIAVKKLKRLFRRK